MSIHIGNINPNDPNYRYKRNILDIRYSGKGKNTKTILVNLKDIAKQIYTMPNYISKFFSYRFATVVTNKNKEWFLKGTYTLKELEEKLEDFITLFIICDTCNAPETGIIVKKEEIRMFCYACGSKNKPIDKCDKKNVFAKYIKRYPHNQSKLHTNYMKKQNNNKKMKKQSSKQSAHMEFPPLPENYDASWTTDSSKLATLSRRQELSYTVSGLIQTDSDSDSQSYYSDL